MPLSLSREQIATQLECHLPPIVLFTGEEDSGKRSLALHLSDYHEVLPVDCYEVNKLTSDVSREVIRFVSTHPFGLLKLVVIHAEDAVTGSFQLLLKTLEEPPLYVKFILTAVNINTIPITIRSRCASYYLHKVGVLDATASGVARSTATALIRSVLIADKLLFDRIMRSMRGEAAEAVRATVLTMLVASLTTREKEQVSTGFGRFAGLRSSDLPDSITRDMIFALSRTANVRPKLALRTALEPLLDTRG